MLDREPMFDSNLGQHDNSIPFFGDKNHFNLPFQQDYNGSFAAPELDFLDVIKQYQESDEFNFRDRFDLFAENHPFSKSLEQTPKEILGNHIEDIIGEKQLDDVLLNSEKQFPGVLNNSNFKIGEGNVPPVPLVKTLKDSAPKDLPFSQPDFEIGDGMIGEILSEG